jgi:hypothetical protein
LKRFERNERAKKSLEAKPFWEKIAIKATIFGLAGAAITAFFMGIAGTFKHGPGFLVSPKKWGDMIREMGASFISNFTFDVFFELIAGFFSHFF